MSSLIKYNFILFLTILQTFFFVKFSSCAVVKMDFVELIQRSNVIFTGTVEKKESRWNDKKNLIVTDYSFNVTEVLYGQADKTLKLTFAGGQLEEEGQSVSDVPEFNVGDEVVLMLELEDVSTFSPITGMYQGKYSSIYLPSYGTTMAFDGDNLLVKDQKNEGMSFTDFVLKVKKTIPMAKAMPLPKKKLSTDASKYIIKDLPSQRYAPLPSLNIDNERSESKSLPKEDDTRNSPPISPISSMQNSQEIDTLPNEGADRWAYTHRAKTVPIVFNQLSETGQLGSHDQYQMAYWNKYSNIFQVYTNDPYDTWAWKNNRYDIAGFVDNQTMIDQFGEGWGSSTLAICWKRWDSTGFSIEADIALNPAFSWTTDDYATYSNSNLHNVDRTLLHEIGHSWGLDHQWYALSVMNYTPHKYRAYTVLYGDDTMAVRDAFSGQKVTVNDLGVSLFYSNGYQNYDDAEVNSQVVTQGASLTVSNVILENSGTNTISTPKINWYLVPSINSWSNSNYLTQTTYSSLDADKFFNTSRTISIPTSTMPGKYYLGAYIANSEDTIDNNDSSWLDKLITVVVRSPTTISATDGTYTDKVSISWSSVTGATSYILYRCTDSSTSNCSTIAYPTTTSYNDTGATSGTTYYYRVKAVASTGSSDYGIYNTGYIALSIPQAPSSISVSDGNYNDKIMVNWSSATTSTIYNLYRCTSVSTSSCIQIYSGNANSYYDYSVKKGIVYFYRIKACNSAGCSSLSSNYDTGYLRQINIAPIVKLLLLNGQ